LRVGCIDDEVGDCRVTGSGKGVGLDQVRGRRILGKVVHDDIGILCPNQEIQVVGRFDNACSVGGASALQGRLQVGQDSVMRQDRESRRRWKLREEIGIDRLVAELAVRVGGIGEEQMGQRSMGR
jgi:hypothetical protein